MRFDHVLLPQCRFLVGPTAVGKTDVSLELAERLNAEIVALDSMTVYRGMDIGTAKPDPAARARTPHHLLDFIDPHEDCSLAEYLRQAEGACRDILARGHVPLFVGGTGLYLRAVLRGIFQGPPADWEIRRRWEAYSRAEGEQSLHARLAEVDPALATRLHPHDIRRVIRGLEVFELTGTPLSRQQDQPARPIAERPPPIPWLFPPRNWLYQRIDERVTAMFERGLVAEVERLLAAGLPPGRTARQALGYREVLDHLENGVPLSETIELIQTRTRQFAKRQHTWFRNLEECTPVEMTGNESPVDLARQLLACG
jgi:tRNA dimethylallyltransferase